MALLSYLECLGCKARYPADRPMQLCPVDGRPVQMKLDFGAAASTAAPDRSGESGGRARAAWPVVERPDLWRYGALLPLDPARAEDARCIVPIGGGWTALDRREASEFAPGPVFDLWIKDEGRAAGPGGGNPTASFKDRGMAMVAAMAVRLGVRRLVVPTQGNAGDSLVEYARAAGLDVAVILPDDTPTPILDRVRHAAEVDAAVRFDLVQGTIREAGALMRAKYLPDGWFSAATFAEPGWRIEGKKTLGLEIAEQLGDGRSFVLPDVIVYPTGGGTGILGMWKAFEELMELGWATGTKPRFVCVQSEATDPLYRAWLFGAIDTTAAEAGSTVAVGLNVPGGVGHFRVLEIVRASGGCVVAVPEPRIAEWSDRYSDQGIGPEGAACLAALKPLVAAGTIRPGDRVVVVNTCGPGKYDPRHAGNSISYSA